MKKLVLTIALAAFAVAASAQEFERYDSSAGTYERITQRGPYLTNRFFDNWFIGVAGGVNYYNGEGDCNSCFSDRLAPALDISLGKWFTPSTGIRFQYSGLKAKGLSTVNTHYTKSNPDKKGYFKKDFNTMNIHADFIWNISNAIGGYKETRTWNFVPFGGFGVARSWKSGHDMYHFAATVGLLNNIRLGGVVDLTLEAKYMFVKPDFDYFTNNDKIDGMASVTAGLTFKLGPKGGFKRPVVTPAADYTPYNQRISALEDELAAEKARAERLAKDLEAEKNRPQPKPQTIVPPVQTTVYFKIGQAQLTDTDMVNLEGIAKTIKATDKVYTITGHADAGTGSKTRNLIIANQRAESVKKALVEKFGVKESQLKLAPAVLGNNRNPLVDRSAKVTIE